MSFGKVVVIESAKDKVPVVIEKSDVALADVPELAGQPCKGFKYGTVYTTVGTSIKIHKIEIEADGTISTHEGATVYVCYVITGEGDLGLVDPQGKTINTFHYKPGDVIVFRPNTLHYWKNGLDKTEMLGVEQYLQDLSRS